MSVIKFELKEEHIKLLKQLRWTTKDGVVVGLGRDGDGESVPPFGENNLYDAIDLILNGVPVDFNPFTTEDIKEYSDEQKAEWDQLYEDLPTALDVILFNGHFNLGTYKTKFHDRVWKEVK
jgi:hypothetical protein